ncbi:hypothetical protein [Halobellus limi]|uniref:Uncharacterized protein n=1 Tax=Halobellus limi TaxID=699433 RepID=A0A1H5WQK4_9EURY|nr:hypothetical protein [Halobellus limi]SEG01658.1 hypothetical protein SAMN04488133_1360 [Halobellus limi]
MGLKGIVLGGYALCLGGLFLFSESAVTTGFGVALIAITWIAVFSRYRLKRASRQRG